MAGQHQRRWRCRGLEMRPPSKLESRRSRRCVEGSKWSQTTVPTKEASSRTASSPRAVVVVALSMALFPGDLLFDECITYFPYKEAISKGVTFNASHKKRRTGSVEDGLHLEVVPARVLRGHGKQKQALIPSETCTSGSQPPPTKPSGVLIYGLLSHFPQPIVLLDGVPIGTAALACERYN